MARKRKPAAETAIDEPDGVATAVAEAPAGDGGGPSARQAELLALSAELFARNGYASTTVRDIAGAAGILSGSLYHHFASKEAIVDAILAPFLDELLARYAEVLAAKPAPRAAFEALATASLEAMERHQAATAIYENDGARLAELPRFAYVRDAGERFEQAWLGVLERGIASGDFRAGLDSRLAHRVIRVALWTVARWYRPDGTLSARQIADAYVALLLDGVAAPRAAPPPPEPARPPSGKKKKGKKR